MIIRVLCLNRPIWFEPRFDRTSLFVELFDVGWHAPMKKKKSIDFLVKKKEVNLKNKKLKSIPEALTSLHMVHLTLGYDMTDMCT